ncbi:hypothetical protein FJY70_05635, partial [candidate division WOR-3 bacterium]|nr:hypothetical protein [candidate division WOR-3 bacterium]
MTIVTLTVSVALSVIPPPELRSFLARRDYDSAITYYRSRLPEGTRNTVDMRNLARVFEHMREYDSAVAWWSQASYYEPSNDSALVGRWNALVHRDEDDSSELLVTKSMIAFDAARLAQGKTARELTLAYDGHVLADSTKAVQVAERLTRLFPDSPRGYELIGSMFYDSLYPVWANDTVKIPIIRRFLVRYPRTEWRQTFYNFLLSSLFGLKDTQGLRQAAQEMTADDTLDPFRYRYAAALFNRLKLDRTTTAQYARRAIELEPKAKKPANKPPEQWDLEYPPLYCQARAALAEALMAEGLRTSAAELREAKTALDEALAHFRWDPQQEATPAQLYYLTGRFWDLADAYGY